MSKYIGIFGNTNAYRYKNQNTGKGQALTEEKMIFLLRNAYDKIKQMDIGDDDSDDSIYFVLEQNTDSLTRIAFEYAASKGIKTVFLYDASDSNSLKLIYKADHHRKYTPATKYKVIFENIDLYLLLGDPKDSYDFAKSYDCPILIANPEE